MNKIVKYFYDYIVSKHNESIEADMDTLVNGIKSYVTHNGIDVAMRNFMEDDNKFGTIMKVKTVPFDLLSYKQLAAFFAKYDDRNKMETISREIFAWAKERYVNGTYMEKKIYEELLGKLYETASRLSCDVEHTGWLDYYMSETLNDLRYACGLQDEISLRLKSYYNPGK